MAEDGLTPMHQAMLDGLDAYMRAQLRARFEVIAKECVDGAITDAMAMFETTIQKYSNPDNIGRVVEVLLTDRRGKGE